MHTCTLNSQTCTFRTMSVPPPTTLFLPNFSHIFKKEINPEHLPCLVSIHQMHLTRMATLFLLINQRAKWKTTAVWTPTPLPSLLFWRRWDSKCDSGHQHIQNRGYVVGASSCLCYWVVLSRPPVFLSGAREKMALCLEVSRAKFLCEYRVELDSRQRRKWGKSNTEATCLDPGLGPSITKEFRGTGSPRG